MLTFTKDSYITTINNLEYFHNPLQNASLVQDMAINNASSQDFFVPCSDPFMMINKVNIQIQDNAASDAEFNSDAFGADLALSNGFRLYYIKDGSSSKVYLSDPILTNNDVNKYANKFNYMNLGTGVDSLTFVIEYNTPVIVKNGGEFGIELNIDDFSGLDEFTCYVYGQTY